jgi:hypothetical protein
LVALPADLDFPPLDPRRSDTFHVRTPAIGACWCCRPKAYPPRAPAAMRQVWALLQHRPDRARSMAEILFGTETTHAIARMETICVFPRRGLPPFDRSGDQACAARVRATVLFLVEQGAVTVSHPTPWTLETTFSLATDGVVRYDPVRCCMASKPAPAGLTGLHRWDVEQSDAAALPSGLEPGHPSQPAGPTAANRPQSHSSPKGETLPPKGFPPPSSLVPFHRPGGTTGGCERSQLEPHPS